jgi:hypothetical protein
VGLVSGITLTPGTLVPLGTSEVGASNNGFVTVKGLVLLCLSILADLGTDIGFLGCCWLAGTG